jgi:transposase-like protein
MDASKTESGRRRWTSKQRQRFLTLFHESQLTQSEFASHHGGGLSTLSKWLRLERDAVPAKVKFQEVRLPSPPQPDTLYWDGSGLWACVFPQAG